MSQVASAISQKETDKSIAWRYSLAGERDLRIDFMRGIALVMMVVAHTEVMSIFNIFSWERFGLTTGAEGFVILSGFMLGMLNRVRLQKAVLLTVGWGLYLRAWKIYQVNIIIIVSFLLLRYLMRWSLPPSRYYAEDRLSFGELSWKTLRSLVSIWVKTLSIFI
ncbi:OpgC domain-containing protein, partial [Klebsiella variicola]|uniref:OpgC domain-containing protein n=2 Tax=Klebsiella variicola TaxID=244366 RepID=UPI002B1FC805